MPMFTEGQDPLTTGQELNRPTATLEPAPSYDRPGGDRLIDAAFRQSNPVVSVLNALSMASPDQRVDPGHNPFDVIKGTKWETEPDAFVGSRNEAETRSIMARFDQEASDREVLAASGSAGTVASLMAGLLDPTVFLPMGGVAKAVEGGYSVAKSAAVTGALSGLYGGVSEGALQASQVSRPNEDIPFVIGSASVLGGLIGAGAAAFLNRVERKIATDALTVDRIDLSKGAGLPSGASGGAAFAGDARTLEPKPLLPPWLSSIVPQSVRDKANEWVMGLSPTQRTFFARDSIEARRGMADLVETAFDFEDNVPRPIRDAEGRPTLNAAGEPMMEAGLTTTRDGLPPVGRQVWMARTAATIDASRTFEREFLSYRYGGDGGSMAKASFEDLRGAQTDKLSFSAFKEEVSKALRNGDAHELEQVQAVAQDLRARIFDPIQKRLVEAGLMKAEDVAPKGDASFLSRLYNKEAIAADRPAFHAAISGWLEGEQVAKAGSKARIQSAATKRTAVGKQISKIERRLNTLEERQKATASQLKERVVELNAADKRDDFLSARETTIREGISELQEFIDTMKDELTDPDALVRLADLEDELTILRQQERDASITPTDIRKRERDEVDKTLTGDMRTAAEVFAGRRNPLPEDTLQNYFVRGGGVHGGPEERAIFKDVKRPGLLRKDRRQIPGLNGKGIVRDADDWGEKLMEDFPHVFPERPSRNEVLDIMREAASGHLPDWFRHGANGEPSEAMRVEHLTGYLNDLFERAGIDRPKSLKDVVRVINSERGIELADLMREDEAMAASGVRLPPGATRQAQEGMVAAERDARAQIQKLIDRARTDRNAAERERVKGGIRKDEARVAVTRSEGRFGLLSDRQDRYATMQDLMEAARANAARERDALSKSIEDELRAWKGNSTAEAIPALHARDEAERIRALKQEAGVYEGKGARLSSADDAVNRAVKRIIKSDRDLSPEEIGGRAHEIIDRILGGPDGRLPYDVAAGGPTVGPPVDPNMAPPRGSLHARDFAIPSHLVEKFLENDTEHVLQTYLRTILPDLMLHERFGDVEMKGVFRKINEEYSAKAMAATSDKARTKLESQRQGAIADLAAVRDRVRNVYGFTQYKAMPVTSRVARNLKNYNSMTDLGGSTMSSIPDLAGAVFRHGFSTVFKDAWAPFVGGLMSMGKGEFSVAAKRQVGAMHLALETQLNMRSHQINDILDNYRPGSKFERGLAWASDKFQLANLQAPWTDIMKTLGATVSSAEHLRAISKVAAGNGSAKDLEMLAGSNINEAMARRIHAEIEAGGGEVIDGTPLADTAKWTDREARESFEAAIGRDVDMMVVTPGHEKPLWMSSPILGLLGQFKSFIAATHERILIPGLQRRDANTLAGLFTAVGTGMMSYRLYSLVTGREASDRPQDWIKEGISRSGVLGWFDEMNNSVLSKLTAGRDDVYRLIGADRPLSKFQQRSAMASLLGPTWGKVEGLSGGMNAAFSGSWSQGDTTRIRRLAPFQNLFYLRGLLNKAEGGINGAFGVPVKAQ